MTEQRIGRLLVRSRLLAARKPISPSHALTHVFRRLQTAIERWQKRHSTALNSKSTSYVPVPPSFLCDAGLGGLARWLRVAGYEARWIADIDDEDLLREARRLSATLITTDSILMERRVLRDGIIPAIWVPPSLTMLEQLEMVLQELRLPRREARCMDCGGEFQQVDKEQMRERIPPRTYRWLDQYFVCRRCGKLFWHGTHWEKIQAQLHKLQKSESLSG